MRLAVFLYANPLITEADGHWLHLLLVAMVQHHESNAILVYTNKQPLLPLAHPRILFPQYSVPTGLWIRSRTLSRWQQAAQKEGVDAIICIGSQSMVYTSMPTYFFQLPARPLSPKEIQKGNSAAAGIWVTSNEERAALDQKGLKKITVLHGGPLYGIKSSTHNADSFKEEHTEGYEYFLYAGPIAPAPNIIGLLKAFSKFKHRQKSSWKLVLLPLGNGGQDVEGCSNLLATYKYRNDIVLPTPELAHATAANFFAAAYAFVQPVTVQPYGNYLPDAIGAALPIIATNEPLHQEWAGNAALYFEAGAEDLLASCLMQLYKDEALWGRLAASAALTASQKGWQHTAAAAWESLALAKK